MYRISVVQLALLRGDNATRGLDGMFPVALGQFVYVFFGVER